MHSIHSEETNNPLWYKDAIIYQVHVRSFYDSNGDGIGDFRGLIQKLDYIQNLGVNTLWLLPFYPSPLKDGGYDIADFTGIHPSYGTLADFRRFVKEAHRRGLRIITELVLNHTSSAHKWFQRARKARPGSVYRDYYVWSDTPDKYKDARIIFQDFEVSNWTYDHEAKAYYWHRFYSHQPDLNFESPGVQKEILKVLDFWFRIGVDGFRLDAVPYLFEAEGTNCENLPETHQYLKKLRKYVDDNHQNKLLLAEANQWPNDASDYFGDGDECHMAFHFPLMPRLYMALQMEDRFPIVDILEQTPRIPENCQWATFLRNHDELTLEMVSDQERDYMYKTFAKDPLKRVNVGIRRRLFPMFGGNLRNIELLHFLLFSMPGTPTIYYGDEIGMGDNYYLGDRDGMRTPMQWSPDKNAGFSEADSQRLFLPVVIDQNYHYTTVNVENQEQNPSSFLWWMRRVIAKRKKYKAFGQGSITFVNTSNPKVLAFVRAYEDEKILVVVNLSRYSQNVELDLHAYAGSVPMELFSRNDFPLITDEPWTLPMQFKNYFWLELRKAEQEKSTMLPERESLSIERRQWLVMGKALQFEVKSMLHDFIIRSKWYKGHIRKLRDINIIDVIAVNEKKIPSYLFLIQLDLIERNKELFFMPVSLALNNKAEEIRSRYPESVISKLLFEQEEALLYDGMCDNDLLETLFGLIRKRSKLKGLKGEVEGSSGSRLRQLLSDKRVLKPHLLAFKGSNTSISMGDSCFLKVYRGLEEGENPDAEILKNLTRHTAFEHISPYLGRLDYRQAGMESTTIALMADFIPNVGNAWKMTQTAIESFFDQVLSEKETISRTYPGQDADMDAAIGGYFLEMMSVLGIRTAEMHLALASVSQVKGFEPESFSLLYQKSLYQSQRTFLKRTFSYIRTAAQQTDESASFSLSGILKEENLFLGYMQQTLEQGKIPAKKTRIHGNYKLDKLLFTGQDFIVTDFEGEVEHPLSVRKLKHCPLKDVASLISSFHYAINKGYLYRKEFVPVNEGFLQPLIESWCNRVTDVYLDSYFSAMNAKGLIPDDLQLSRKLLNLFLLEKAVEELKAFYDHQSANIIIPVKALQKISKQIITEDL
jgi:maltose alpha-D-glucosyltransferase / alpha-amylase